MEHVSPDEVRVRVTVDSDNPELLNRLAGYKRPAREIVHLLRLGLQMEMMLNGNFPMLGIASEGSASASIQAPASAGPGPAADVSENSPADIPHGGAFAEMTGLDSDYFSGAPMNYSG